MLKKFIVILLSLFFLAACGKKEAVTVDFNGPMGGPDPIKVTPSYGPNDPVPVNEPIN